MKTSVCILFFLGAGSLCFAQQQEIVRNLKLHNPAFPSEVNDCEVVQVLEQPGFPSGYHMRLATDVCEDHVCKMLEVTLYWDATGNYVKLDYPADAPLTKNNHEEFSPDDYRKLDEILSSSRSVLNRYPLKEIVPEKNSEFDAITGATPSELQSAVIEGAAYTTWVLWHWVNGEIPEHLAQMTRDSSSPEFIQHCLQTGDQNLVEYALTCTDGDPQFWNPVRMALDQMDYGNLVSAVHYLGQVDPVRTAELIGQVSQRAGEQIIGFFSKEKERLRSDVIEILASRLPQMTYYELHTSLALFDKNGYSSERMRRNITALVASSNPFIARRATEYIQRIDP